MRQPLAGARGGGSDYDVLSSGKCPPLRVVLNGHASPKSIEMGLPVCRIGIGLTMPELSPAMLLWMCLCAHLNKAGSWDGASRACTTENLSSVQSLKGSMLIGKSLTRQEACSSP